MIDGLFTGPWVLLYRHRKPEAWCSALLSPKKAKEALSSTSWDYDWSRSGPGVVQHGSGDDAQVVYERFPEKGLEPVVHARDRDGAPTHIEVAEDLRLFLDLFPGSDGNLYAVGESLEEQLVVRILADEVQILKAPLLQYLRARQMYLAVYFDHHVWLKGERDHLLPQDQHELEVAEEDRRWDFVSTEIDGTPFSRLCGKRLLPPPPRGPDPLGGDEKRFAEFIIGYDGQGKPVEHSADPDGLANFFGANAGAPKFLTSVHFRREVLDRYFHDPGRFVVADGSVRCGSQWLLKMDDDHSDRVIAFLGDLGRELPYTEQLHWRVHNITPDAPLSSTAWARSFEARFADGARPEHRFKASYQRLADTWTDAFGWPLFRPLPSGDGHLLDKLHIPSGNNPAELDAQLLGLAKILVDSLNDAALDAALAAPIENERSLAKLKRFLVARAYPHVDRDLAILRSIQGLRSSGVAHTRGSNYEKELRKLGLAGVPAPRIVERLVGGATEMLDSLSEHAVAARPEEGVTFG